MRPVSRVRRRLPLPVIDLADARGSRRTGFLDQLRKAAAGPGAFYLTGHGIPAGFGDLVLSGAREFFAAPGSERLGVNALHSPHFRGHVPASAGDRRLECFDVGPEQAARRVGPDDPPWHRLEGPNLWPSGLPTLEPLLLTWTDTLTELAERVLGLLLLSVRRPSTSFDAALAPRPHTRLSLLRAARGNPRDGVLAKDYGFLTMLLADQRDAGRAGGLRVTVHDTGRGGHPRVVDVPSIDAPGETFVVTIGRLLEAATHGYLRSAPYGIGGQRGVTVSYALGPALDAIVPALPLASQLVRDARGVPDDPADPLLSGYGAYALRHRIAALPQVAERHHPELLVAG
jgi:isopenicillin N synthase-like dioxygenase